MPWWRSRSSSSVVVRTGYVASAMSSPVGDYLPHLKSGKLRLLATSGAQRSKLVPDVATYAEQGLPALTMNEWYGFFLPGKAAPDVVAHSDWALRAC